jgi:hypothetical protein
MEQNRIDSRHHTPFSIGEAGARPQAAEMERADPVDAALERQNAILEKISDRLASHAQGGAESEEGAENEGLMKKIEELLELLKQLLGGGESAATDSVGSTGQPANQQ